MSEPRRWEVERDRFGLYFSGHLGVGEMLEVVPLSLLLEALEAIATMKVRVAQYQLDDLHRDGLAHIARSLDGLEQRIRQQLFPDDPTPFQGGFIGPQRSPDRCPNCEHTRDDPRRDWPGGACQHPFHGRAGPRGFEKVYPLSPEEEKP